MKKYLKYIFIVIILIISFLLFFFYSNKREEKTIDIEPSPSTEEPISESITITLKYNSDIDDYICKTSNGYFKCDIPKPKKKGNSFIGWFTENDEEKSLDSVFTEDIILFGKWEKEKYNISFNLNGGIGTYTDLEVEYSEQLPELTNPIPTRNDYYFMGWYDTKDPTKGKQYYDNSNKGVIKYTKDENITLYAGWASSTQDTYTVSFDANGGIGAIPNNVQATYGYGMPSIGSAKPTKVGYQFIGWFDNKNHNNGKRYYDASNLSVTTFDKKKDLKLYAGWKQSTYTVKFNLNGGSGNIPPTLSLTYNATMPNINVSPPTRVGYNFLGWYDNSNYQSGIKYYNSNGKPTRNYDKQANSTLYAAWSGKSYVVSFNLNSGSGTVPSNVTVTTGNPMPTISFEKPIKVGMDFTGWYDSQGTKYYNADGTSARNYDKGANTVLFAGWQNKNFLSGSELSTFKSDNNINRANNYVVFKETRNVNGVTFNVYFVYNRDNFSQEEYIKYLDFARNCLLNMGKIDYRVLRKIRSSNASIVFLGSYDCDNGIVNVGYYTYAAYCNSLKRNLVMGYNGNRYGNDYYYNSLVHETGHAYDFTMRYFIANETGHGITGYTSSQVNNGYTNSSGVFVSSSNIRQVFLYSSNHYLIWSELANDYTDTLMSNVSNFSVYSASDLKNRPLEFYAEVFRAYFENSTKKNQLRTSAPIVYNALEKTLQYSY